MNVRFKTWLRGPDAYGEPVVEFVGEQNGRWRSGRWQQRKERSIMAELLSADEVRRLQVDEGRWYLPDPPP